MNTETIRISEAHGKGSAGIFFEGRLLERRRSRYQEIMVLENDDYGRVLLLDGMVMTTELDAPFYHEPLVHPALTAHRD
ncbi:MAG: polyamine aminopropyltransferase, partial [Deltaproteobacteria bacterium]